MEDAYKIIDTIYCIEENAGNNFSESVPSSGTSKIHSAKTGIAISMTAIFKNKVVAIFIKTPHWFIFNLILIYYLSFYNK